MSADAQSPIRLIVGLGNPGSEYEWTRHNAGCWYVDEIARRYGAPFKLEKRFSGQLSRIRVGGRECLLLKPTTFMNRSGQSVSALAAYFKIDQREMLVAHDELDLAPGVVRLKEGGGHAGHNGLRDIIRALGGREFWRLRIGIDHPGPGRDVASYVLSRPPREDADAIMQAVEAAEKCLGDLLDGAFQKVMHNLHTRR
jgi:PTH1 family peptidyl-tRNA hydrolase